MEDLYPKSNYNWTGATLILASGLTVISAITLVPVLPEMLQTFRDVPDAGLWVPAVLSVAGLGGAFSAPLAGLLGDRYDRRLSLILFSTLFAAAGALPLLLGDFTVLLVSRIIVGIACMNILVISTAMIGDIFAGAERDRWLAGQAIVATFSALLVMPAAGLLGSWLGWRGPLLLFLAGFPLAAACWFLPGNPGESLRPIGSRVPWSSLPWRWLGSISAMFGGAAILFYSVQMQLGRALATMAVSDPAEIGLMSMIALLGIPTGAAVFMKIAAWPFGRLMRLEVLVAGTTLIAMRYVDEPRALVAVAFINLAASGMMVPTLMTHLSRHLEVKVRARGIGISQAAFSIGQFFSVAITSLVAQEFDGGVLYAFWILGLGSVIIALLSMLRPSGRPQTKRAG